MSFRELFLDAADRLDIVAIWIPNEAAEVRVSSLDVVLD